MSVAPRRCKMLLGFMIFLKFLSTPTRSIEFYVPSVTKRQARTGCLSIRCFRDVPSSKQKAVVSPQQLHRPCHHCLSCPLVPATCSFSSPVPFHFPVPPSRPQSLCPCCCHLQLSQCFCKASVEVQGTVYWPGLLSTPH